MTNYALQRGPRIERILHPADNVEELAARRVQA